MSERPFSELYRGEPYRSIRHSQESRAEIRQQAFEEAAKAIESISIQAGGKHSIEAANYGIKVAAATVRTLAKEQA